MKKMLSVGCEENLKKVAEPQLKSETKMAWILCSSVSLLVKVRWGGINRDSIWSHCLCFATRRGHGYNHECVLECITQQPFLHEKQNLLKRAF